MNKKNLLLALAALLVSNSLCSAQVTVWLTLPKGQDADKDSKAEQLKIGSLLSDPSSRQVLPGGVVRFESASWSAKVDAKTRQESLKNFGNAVRVEEATETAQRGGTASRAAAALPTGEVKSVSSVPGSLTKADAAAGNAAYDGSVAKGSVNSAAGGSNQGKQAPPPTAPAQQPAAAAPLQKAPSSGLNLGAIDATTRQCDDFYQYACGKWIKENPIPNDQTSWGFGQILHENNQALLKQILEKAASAAKAKSADEKKLGDIYAACMDTKTIDKKGAAPLKPDFNEIGKLSSLKDLASQLGRLHAKGFGGVFGFGSEQDFEDASMTIAAIDQSGISLPDRDYYLKDEHKDDLKAFGEHVAKMFELTGDKKAQAAAEAAAVVAIETKLAEIQMDEVSRRDPTKTHAKTALAKFESLSPAFDWKTYFKTLGAPKIAEVDVISTQFFQGLDKVLTTTPVAAWKSYLRWQVLHGRAGLLSKSFGDENFAFWGRRLSGQKEQKPRWKKCVGAADGIMGEALGRDYVEKAFPGSAKDDTLKMVGEIESAMKDDISGVTWMSPQTQAKALQKLSEVTNKIGYPDKWRDYSDLKISRTDALGNADRAAAKDVKKDLAKIGKPADRKEWGMTPPTVNAYYDPSNNNINFPAGILQAPYYDPKADAAVNYGSIGAIEGHELTHGFDDEGHQYDGKGNLKNWWTPQDQAAFEARSKGLIDQYDKFVIAKDPGGDPKKDVHVNGALTLGENTADNGGIRLAYAAYKKSQAGKPGQAMDGYTPDQRFFLGFAQSWCENQTEQSARLQAFDPHPISKFRVLGTLANMPEFAQAFSCKAGDAMVNPNPARVW